VDSQSRVIVGTEPSTGDGAQLALLRLLSDGRPDPSFGQGGTAILDPERFVPDDFYGSYNLEIDQEDRPVVSGADGPLVAARLTEAGVPDTSFSADGVATTYMRLARVRSAGLVLADNRLVIGGVAIPRRGPEQLLAARLELEDGPPDADADGIPDGSEDCPYVFGTCPEIRTRALIRLKTDGRKALRATAFSRVTECREVRTIEVLRAQDGLDPVIATGSPPRGRFFLRPPPRPGRYYAVIREPKIIEGGSCSPARSKLVRVPRRR
jgi:hypothetical protein